MYIHCHHGKYRGPTAAAAVLLCLDEKCSVEWAFAEMKQAGAAPNYKDLYDVPRLLIRPTCDELDRFSSQFPEVAEVSDLAQRMVDVDAHSIMDSKLRRNVRKPAKHAEVC